jgi:hypothetical protein
MLLPAPWRRVSAERHAKEVSAQRSKKGRKLFGRLLFCEGRNVKGLDFSITDRESHRS